MRCITAFPHIGLTARLPQTGGRGQLFTPQQEEAICTMVRVNNAMRLGERQRTIIEDNDVFENIHTVSISTIDRVLHRNQMSMKQLYRVPFQRNEDRVKELRYQYVQVKHISM
jgi:transposase